MLLEIVKKCSNSFCTNGKIKGITFNNILTDQNEDDNCAICNGTGTQRDIVETNDADTTSAANPFSTDIGTALGAPTLKL